MERVPTIDGMRAHSLRGDRINETISASGIFAIAKDEVPSSFPIVITIWLVGIGLCTLRLAGGLWKLHGFKQNGTTRAEAEWHKRLAVLCDELGIGRTVELIRSDLITTPIAVGLIKPMIIVPTSLFLQIPAQQLEVIILHELIHIRRFDCLVNAFQCVAEILFFYHPAVWWMSAEIRREREFAADAAVLKVAGDRVIYATALADLEELRLTANMTVPSTAVAANGGNLMERIKRILNKKTEISGASSAWSAGIAISTISIFACPGAQACREVRSTTA